MTTRSAMFIAHPGHELRLHHWMEQKRPIVYILTDGSGRQNRARTRDSRDLLERCGAVAGPIFGRFTDRKLYELLLTREVEPVAEVVRELTADLRRHKTGVVIGDSWELYNPTHDLARIILDLAVARSGRKIDNYEIADGDVTIELDEAALSRKLAALEDYTSMRKETDAVLRREGMNALRFESLRRATPPWAPMRQATYEQFGADRVAAGHYREVIRYAEHFAPFVAALYQATQSTDA